MNHSLMIPYLPLLIKPHFSFRVQIFVIYAQKLLKFTSIIYNMTKYINTRQERMGNMKITKFAAKLTTLCLMGLSVIFSNMLCTGNWYEPKMPLKMKK